MDSKNNQQSTDADIKACREKILSRKTIVPPLGRPPMSSPKPAVTTNSFETSDEKTVSMPEPEKEVSDRIEIQSQPPIEQVIRQEEPAEAFAQVDEDEAVSEIPESDTNWPFENSVPEPDTEMDKLGETAAVEEQFTLEQAINEIKTRIDAAARTPEAVCAESIEENEDEHAEPMEDSEIPEFNLAEQIMAEQRKVSGNRRKGPGSSRIPIIEEKPKTSSPARTVAQAPMSPQQRLIAEIVAEDIRRFYMPHMKSRSA